MSRRRTVESTVVSLMSLAVAMLWVADRGVRAQDQTDAQRTTITDAAGRKHIVPRRITAADREAAAERLRAKRTAATGEVGVTGEVGAAAPMTSGYRLAPNGQLIPDYSGLTPNWAYSPLLTKFVDPLPGLYISGIGQQLAGPKYIPVGQPQVWPVGCTPPDAPVGTCDAVDYYEIELGEYNTWSFHSEMPYPTATTKLRGYRQTNATDPNVGVFSYLGPIILAQKGRPVRVKFTNNLPVGLGGRLNIPVDTTVMGSGAGPLVSDSIRMTTEGQLCTGVAAANCFTQNRATIHLHGGVTPWISDGTTHQWITPAGESTPYPNGASVYNVPDMVNPGKPGSPTNPVGSGVQTFYWTNDQAARLMFYHDHAAGITRLNVYVGEAAGYLLRDSTEAALETANLIPGLLDNIPLVLQEKAFVNPATIGLTDPTWNWGTAPGTHPVLLADGTIFNQKDAKLGDLWFPHVYQPAQNPADISGYNAMGRWNYGPWFFPPTPIAFGPVANPYYNPADPLSVQPPQMPGSPNPSWGAEAFLDTPVVNGTAYPKLTVEAKPYRFRILNAGNDRFFNLHLYMAADNTSATTAVETAVPGAITRLCDGSVTPTTLCTEVKMVPAAINTGLPANWPQDGREGGVPDPTTAGPSFVMIGSEGGFLPMPVVVPHQPIVWNGDPLTFNFGNVSDFALLLGPAERADTIVDFTGLAGKTYILYNDAPAAFPASDPRNDYYTGNPDQTDTGGTVPTLAGKGPNTRTVMQIEVVAATGTPMTFNLPNLVTAFTSAPQTAPAPRTLGVFEASQDPIIVGQTAYNEAYGKTFPSRFPYWGLGTIYDSNVSFETVAGQQVTLLAQPKAIHDEMGATFDEYGRMKAMLGVQMPNPTPNLANFIMQAYADPATELVKLVATPVDDPTLDGTQIWRINHNGVDSHPIHFHLFHVQLVNRVGWDGAYRLPHPTELGWKDTVRVSPLEDTYVALRPIAPTPESLPFKVPNSFRPMEPALPIGSTLGFENLDPLGNPIVPALTNQEANFGWEYVWHCHILSHEENDMMRAVVFATTPETPTGLTANRSGLQVNLSWTDNSLTANGFTIERTNALGATALFNVAVTPCANQAGCAVTATNSIPAAGNYSYRVAATNTVGSGVPVYPSITTTSLWSNAAPTVTAPTVTAVAPTSGSSAGGTNVTITGTLFVNGATVMFGGVAATNVMWVSATQITATTPAHAVGTVDVVVTNPDTGFGTLANGFAYMLSNAAGDFNGDGNMDIVWRNYATGADAVWLMNGNALLGALSLPTVTDTTWQIVGVGDFNADGSPDLLWRNTGTALTVLWYLNGASIIGSTVLPSPGTAWQVAAVGDFDTNGSLDLVWRNTGTGVTVLWYMNGPAIVGSDLLPTVADLTWQIVGVGDFNANGALDFVWHNTSTGQNAVWYMNGAAIVGSALLPSVADTTWQIVSVGDFNGDAQPDLLWRQTGTGQNALWFMNGASISAGAGVPTLSDTNWAVLYPR